MSSEVGIVGDYQINNKRPLSSEPITSCHESTHTTVFFTYDDPIKSRIDTMHHLVCLSSGGDITIKCATLVMTSQFIWQLWSTHVKLISDYLDIVVVYVDIQACGVRKFHSDYKIPCGLIWYVGVIYGNCWFFWLYSNWIRMCWREDIWIQLPYNIRNNVSDTNTIAQSYKSTWENLLVKLNTRTDNHVWATSPVYDCEQWLLRQSKCYEMECGTPLKLKPMTPQLHTKCFNRWATGI